MMGRNLGQQFGAVLVASSMSLGAMSVKSADTPEAPTVKNQTYTQKLENCAVGAVAANAPEGAVTRVRNFQGSTIIEAEQNPRQQIGQSLRVEIGAAVMKLTVRDDGPRDLPTDETNSFASVTVPNIKNLGDARMLASGGTKVNRNSLVERGNTARATYNQIRSCMTPTQG